MGGRGQPEHSCTNAQHGDGSGIAAAITVLDLVEEEGNEECRSERSAARERSPAGRDNRGRGGRDQGLYSAVIRFNRVARESLFR